MRCLTTAECAEWLQSQGIAEHPPVSNDSWLRCKPPVSFSKLAALLRDLFDEIGDFQGALLQFKDWPLYSPDEMALITSLRRAHNENRWLIDAPGHHFTREEKNEALGHTCLCLAFGWNAYLYVPATVSMYFWEGEFIDIWCCEKAILKKLNATLQRFEIV